MVLGHEIVRERHRRVFLFPHSNTHNLVNASEVCCSNIPANQKKKCLNGCVNESLSEGHFDL